MQAIRHFWAGIVITIMAQGAGAQTPAPVAPAYGVTYIEVVPGTSGKALSLLRGLRSASLKSAGNVRFEPLQRRERPSQFAIIEVWKDTAAFEAALAAAPRRKFRDDLQPLLAAGYDERPHSGLAVGESLPAANAGAAVVFTVTHVDYIPPRKDDGIAALMQMVEPSRRDPGNLRYDVLQQMNRPNHLTLVEAWQGHKALEAHEGALHTVRFRDVITPMSGALFDQRLYRAIN